MAPATQVPSPSLTARAPRPMLGIAMVLAFCTLAPIGDAAAKVLGDRVPLIEVLLVRFALTLVLVPFARDGIRAIIASPRLLRLTVVRSGLHVAATAMFFVSLRYLELADAIAIAFAMPFVLLLLGRFFGGEEAGPRRIAACVVGFAGTLLVVQPSFADVGLPALLPLGVAVLFALFMLVTRQLAVATDAVALQALGGALLVPCLFGALLVSNATGWIEASWPDPREALLLLAIGTIGVTAHLTMTWALRYVSASAAAPVQYVEIPIATLVGWVVFGDWPDGRAAIGIAVIVVAGLTVIWLERRASVR